MSAKEDYETVRVNNREYIALCAGYNQLYAENEELVGKVKRLNYIVKVLEDSCYNCQHPKRVKELECQKNALQQVVGEREQSAKDQYKVGMKNAADRIAEYRANRPTTEAGMLIAEECEILIREAAKEGK